MSDQGDLKPFQWISEINPIDYIQWLQKEQDNLTQHFYDQNFF